MDDLIERALEEGRVDRADRAHPFGRHARREGHGVLLGNARVVDAIRMRALEAVEARSIGHCRGDRHNPRVAVRNHGQRIRKQLGPRGRALLAGTRQRLAGLWVEGLAGVPAVGVRLGGRKTMALLGDGVEDDRPRGVAQLLDRGQKFVDIVPVDWAEIKKTK